MLKARADDIAYCKLLPALMRELLHALRAVEFGYPDEVESVVSAARIKLTEEAAKLAGYSAQFADLIQKLRSGELLTSSHLALSVLRLLEVCNTAHRTVDEVGWESAQVLLGMALFRSIEEVNTPGGAHERDAVVDLVHIVLRSELCQLRFVQPLLSAHPLASSATISTVAR